jgi:radical SAM protein with 4Fe4S-binding SPASM domain
MFELTYACNFKCKHCYVPQSYKRKKGELKTKEVFSILDQLKQIGCFYLGFTGGEPFVRRDIMDILRYAKGCGFEVIIYTNASLINEKTADELAALSLNKVDITIPAMSEAAFEKISEVPASRDKVFNTIELLHKKRVNLGFKSCVLKENETEIKEIQDFATSLSAPHRLDDMLSRRLDGSEEPYKYRGQVAARPGKAKRAGENREERRPSVLDCQLPEEIKNLKPNIDNLFKCGVGVSQAAITPFGELKMCLMIDYPKYNVLEVSLRDCWQRLRELASDIKPDENYQCNKCELEPYCKWCPAKAWLYNGSFTYCEPESRRRAGIRKTRAPGVKKKGRVN